MDTFGSSLKHKVKSEFNPKMLYVKRNKLRNEKYEECNNNIYKTSLEITIFQVVENVEIETLRTGERWL